MTAEIGDVGEITHRVVPGFDFEKRSCDAMPETTKVQPSGAAVATDAAPMILRRHRDSDVELLVKCIRERLGDDPSSVSAAPPGANGATI
jgi:hypothetical protein